MMAIRVACFVLWLTIGLYGKLAFGARYNVMGSQDEEQQIRLKVSMI